MYYKIRHMRVIKCLFEQTSIPIRHPQTASDSLRSTHQQEPGEWLFYFLLFSGHTMCTRDLSSLTRNPTRAPCSGTPPVLTIDHREVLGMAFYSADMEESKKLFDWLSLKQLLYLGNPSWLSVIGGFEFLFLWTWVPLQSALTEASVCLCRLTGH